MELGHSSLFYFLHRELRLSKGAAQYRKVAAELIQEVPGVVEPLRDGRLCLTSIIEAAKVVTAENWETVLPRFYGLSRREAMEVVAALQPHPAPPARTVVTSVRPEPGSRRAVASSSADGLEPREEPRRRPSRSPASLVRQMNQLPPRALRRSPVPPLEVVPLTAEQSRLHLTVSRSS